jgi:hypothetical protein
MTQADFTLALEQELQIRGVRFSRADLQEFVADIWPLAAENSDPATWAQEFIDSGRGTMLA